MKEKKLQEECLHQRKSGANTHGHEKARAPGDKLKNETSARRAMGKKIRHGKSDNAMSPEEKKLLQKKQVRSRKAIDRDMAVRAAAHKEVDAANEDQNVAVQAVNDTGAAAEETIDVLQRQHYSKKLRSIEGDAVKAADTNPAAGPDTGNYSGPGGKLGKNARAANRNAGEATENAGAASGFIQKKRMQKEFQHTAARMSEKQAANQVGNISKRFVDKAEDLMGRLGEWVVEFLEEHAFMLLFFVIILLVVLSVGSCASGGGLLMGTFGHSTVESSYTADDDQILAVEEDYKKLEEDLQSRIDNIESEYPDYDEYRYSLAEINHNPYELAALLTVLYEDYEEDEVQEKLQEIFDLQYTLTTESITEIRTRTETRHKKVTDADGNTSTEEYEVEVEYEYNILKVTLTSKTMAEVIEALGLTDDEMSRYELLVETFGNKEALFAEDIYAAPNPGEYQDYEIPAEALTNERFANMINEAEKYLGYPYVWGGSNPSTSFDCSGFVSYVINHCGNGWNVGRQTANGLLSSCTRISKSEAQPGDLIFFEKTYNTSGASHVGIYVGDGMMLHCGSPIQYTSINTSYWQSHFYTFGRIK